MENCVHSSAHTHTCLALLYTKVHMYKRERESGVCVWLWVYVWIDCRRCDGAKLLIQQKYKTMAINTMAHRHIERKTEWFCFSPLFRYAFPYMGEILLCSFFSSPGCFLFVSCIWVGFRSRCAIWVDTLYMCGRSIQRIALTRIIEEEILAGWGRWMAECILLVVCVMRRKWMSSTCTIWGCWICQGTSDVCIGGFIALNPTLKWILLENHFLWVILDLN